jgi:ABC-type lipoprotein release transport system permease subunit
LDVLRLLFRASFRGKWRSWLLLCLLIALVSGLILAASSAGRRTSSAFPGYEAAHGYDAFFYGTHPIPKVATLSEVESATEVKLPTTGTPTCACSRPINNSDFSLFEVPLKSLPRMVKLEAGRMPNQSDPNQVLASFTLQKDDGVHIGTVIRVPLFAASQRSAVLNDATLPAPKGPTVALRVVGIEAGETEFPVSASPSYDLYTTKAFARMLNQKSVVVYAYFVRLRNGSADLPRFEIQAKALGSLSVTDLDAAANTIESSIQPQAVGWWILAGLAALVGIIVVAQALARQATVEADDYPTLNAIGVSRHQLVVLTMARTLTIGTVGALGGMVLAFFLSPLTLVGEAKMAGPSSGFAFDPLVFLLGALVAIVIVLALGLWPAIRTTRVHNSGESAQMVRPSRIVALLAGGGAPPSALIGVRHALERGRGRNAVPIGSAMLGAILAVTALCATAVFGASLTHLTSTPALYGQPYDLSFSVNGTGNSPNNQILPNLERASAISDITAGLGGDFIINDKIVPVIAGYSVRGQLLATTISGRLPRGDHEVAMGATTLRQLGAHVGSLVRVMPTGKSHLFPTSLFRVVGTVVLSPYSGTGGLGTGAVFNLGALLSGPCPPGPKHKACVIQTVVGAGGAFVVRAAPGPAGRASLTQLARAYPSEVTFPGPPTNLVNFGEAVNFPLIFGAVLILFGAATLTHFLVVSVVRRRREVGLLKALGFVRRQVAFSVSWQTTTVALVGIVVGVPAGIAVGRLVWRVFANNLGVVPVPVVIVWVIAAVAFGTVLIANVLAIGPALVASRSHPAILLKAE